MGTPLLRVRLVFQDRSILSKTQRSDGMNHSWILLRSQQHQTISDVCTHLLHIFKLHRSCPNGIILSMDGFALPPFESTEILKDKEIICVKKKGGATPEAGTLLEDDGSEPGDNGLLLLANDKSDKETEEYQSEPEEIDEEKPQDEKLPEEAASKKRKSSTKLQNSMKKKRCLGMSDDDEDEAETEEIENVNNNASHPRKISSKEADKSAATSKKKVKSPSTVKGREDLKENIEEANQVSNAPGSKKAPSRSARRKKAKRQWMRELAKIAKKKPQAHSKPQVTKAVSKEDNGQPKGLLHWKQALKKPVQNGNLGTDISAVTRPGHIRFEHLDEDQAAKRTGVLNEPLKRNGNYNKRKGQKRGREKCSTSRRNDTKRINKESFKLMFKDAQVPLIDPKDFDKLSPCCEPKEGDVIAYRLLELNASWIPEFSSFRVGRISYYDARDIVLIPVPEYPIAPEQINADGPNDSLYEEDGSLEINYSALVDVRNIMQYDGDARETGDNGVNLTSQGDDKDATENLVSNSNDNNIDVQKDSNPGEVNPWERLSNVNSKNTEMPDLNHSSMVGSGLNTSSYGMAGPSSSMAPDANKAESSVEKDGQKSNTSDPWLSNANKPAPDAYKAELSVEKDGQKSNSSDPWLSNANKPEPSQEKNTGWTDVKKTGPTENNCENGGSWGRPWSTFVISRSSSVMQQNKENEWRAGSSRGNGKPWSRGAPRGRGRGGGRGRGRGRYGNM